MRLITVCFLILSMQLTAQDLRYVRYLVDTLCTEQMAGRGYVDDGVNKAATFLADQFDSLEVKPLNTQRFQPFVHPVNTFPEQATIRLNGQELVAGVDFLVNPFSPSHSGKYRVVRLDTTYIWHPERIRLEANTALLIDPVSVHNADGRSLRVGLVRALAEYAPIIDPVSKLTWSVGTATFKHPVIEIDQHNTNWQHADSVAMEVSAELISAFESKNVLGLIAGSDSTAEYVVFTAHYDHLGKMGEVIFPGANDNASGTAMLLDLARHFAKNPPKTNVLFMACAGEEAGLVGSKYFVEHPLIPLDSIRFLINLDLTGNGEDGITVVNGLLHEEDFHRLAKINSANGLVPKINARGPAANSDHYWFSKNGVPSFFIYTLGDRKAYHDIYDVPETLEFRGYEGLFNLVLKFVDQL